MTFSIAGYDPATGQIGVAVTSSSIAVAARCAFVRAGVGAALSQNVTDPRLGPRLLDDMAGGMAAPDALAARAVLTEERDYRQMAALDTTGSGAFYSGDRTLGKFAGAVGTNCVAVGNLLANEGVPGAIVSGFEGTEGPLAGRLIAALDAGLEAGGEEGDLKSAGVLVAHEQSWPYVDLRVDWAEDPILELAKTWGAYAPEADDYVTRALDPGAAPSFGVPGDE